ncbi:MAG: addiction module protein [bacterium]|jgi:hypothetical protein|nr:addiction module protein [bacterium]
MEPEVKEIIKSAISLPSNLRASLAELLLESLDFEDDFPVSDDWINEIEKRCDEIDGKKIELIEGEYGLSQLRARYS